MNMLSGKFTTLCLATVLSLAGPGALLEAQAGGCLRCHGDRSIAGTKKGYLFVDPAKFARTTHALIGCRSCHDRVSRNHPGDGIRPSRAACGECHATIQEEYALSLHGSKAACPDCHNPHAAKALTVVSGLDINLQCAKCHDHGTTVATHGRWLPQADLHIAALPCITCHTASRNYVIVLYIERRGGRNRDFQPATFGELSRLSGESGIQSLIDTNSDGFVSIAELRAFNRSAKSKGVRLWGMMMPEAVTHRYEIQGNRWDCSFCHASGPKAMQTSYVAFPDGSGRYARLAVEKGAILDLLYGTPDFYMMGSTRSTPLSILGGVIVLGGIMVPIGHGTLRFLTRKRRKEKTP